MAVKKKPEPLKPKPGAPCAECAMGSPVYVPCGRPASYVVIGSDGVAIPMCATDADHNVQNRGATLALATYRGEIIGAAEIRASLGQGALLTADVEADDAPATDQQLSTISVNVSRALKLQELIIPELMGQVATAQAEFKQLTEVVLPNALTDAKMGGYVYRDRNDGEWDVNLVEDIKASVTKENKPVFVEHLVETRQDDLLKRKIVIKFGRDQVALAKKFLADLAKRKIDLHPEVEEEVNYQTLNAWVRELRQNAIDTGKDPDAATPPMVSIYKMRFVKFAQKKAKKGVAQFDN